MAVGIAACWSRDNTFDPGRCLPRCALDQQRCVNGRCQPIVDSSTSDLDGAPIPDGDGDASPVDDAFISDGISVGDTVKIIDLYRRDTGSADRGGADVLVRSDTLKSDSGSVGDTLKTIDLYRRDAGSTDRGGADVLVRSDTVKSDSSPLDSDRDGDPDVTDCDDNDSNVFNGQQQFFTKISKSGSWDYNCDGRVSKFFARGQCVQDGMGCRVFIGLETDVACGKQGALISGCQGGFGICRPTLGGVFTQGCR